MTIDDTTTLYALHRNLEPSQEGGRGGNYYSFLRASMHEFLNPAFTFLFRDKQDDAKIVIANEDLKVFKDVKAIYTDSTNQH